MKKIRCLVSAGPTREYFDPVRYISNPSSGKMGYAVAQAARDAGWNVVLVSGPCSLKPPENVEFAAAVSAQDMFEKCEKYFSRCDILVMAAAVSDVRPKETSRRKLKKDEIDLNPRLERTPDIVSALAAKKGGRIVVGFAAETENVLGHAREKLRKKNLDCIVANRVSGRNTAFASDENKICAVLRGGGKAVFGPAPKTVLGAHLVEFLRREFFGGKEGKAARGADGAKHKAKPRGV